MNPTQQSPKNSPFTPKATSDTGASYEQLQKEFIAQVKGDLAALQGEIAARNKSAQERDQYIYGNLLDRAIDIPIGHDHTPVNWLRRTVEIHKNIFMGRGFKVISTYNTDGTQSDDPNEKQRIQLENSKRKDNAELRDQIIENIIIDNGGYVIFEQLAENASAVGDAIVKAWYDEDDKKYMITQVEAIENCYALWSRDDYRDYDLFCYVYQVSKQQAIRDYGADDDVATSPLGQPLAVMTSNNVVQTVSNQPMVTIMEITGTTNGWASTNGIVRRVDLGKETPFNATIVGDKITKVIDEKKKMPKYYILPNKRVRRRPWGQSDITDAAINLNVTYVETLSDWRTVASKVNFPKYKGFGFSPDAQIPKYDSRRVQILPLAEGQDIQPMLTGDSHQIDWRAQLDEMQKQFVREVAISRVLLDDPEVSLNSNQALLTSMKPTSDVAEAKKLLWAPILTQIFRDALETCAEFIPEFKTLVATGSVKDEDWKLRVLFPTVMQKEDPVFQQMLVNRFHAGTMSVQTFLEQQGESKEEIDRIRDEMLDPITAAIHGNMLGLMAQRMIAPPGSIPPKVNVNFRGDLTPEQAGNLADTHGFETGMFPATIGPQGREGLQAQENQNNQGMITGGPQTPTYTMQPVNKPGPAQAAPAQGATAPGTPAQGAPLQPGQSPLPGMGAPGSTPGVPAPAGMPTPGAPAAQIATPGQNQPGQQPISQPGSGATATSAQGALDKRKQNSGR